MKKKIIYIVGYLLLMIVPNIVQAKESYLYETIKKQGILDNQSSEFVANDAGIQFSEIASDTNGKGVYIIANTQNDKYPILYYRGDVIDNYVTYAGFCWRILRTTDEGGTKLLYSGKVNENSNCTLITGADLTIGKVGFGEKAYEEYRGYMYSLEGEEPNKNNSLIKTTIDNWFKNNMTSHIDYLEDSIFCNDRSVDENDRMNSYERIIAGKPTLTCTNIEDSFTVSSSKGNGKLTYPVGIITADEVYYAGGSFETANLTYFLNIGVSYWSMTPYSANKIFYPNSKGFLNRNSITYSAGIRPIVVLKNEAIYENGDGTIDNPYAVVDKKYYSIVTSDDIITEKNIASQNEKISIAIESKEGYVFKELQFYNEKDNLIQIQYNNEEENKYSFMMPNYSISIKAIYEENSTIIDPPNSEESPIIPDKDSTEEPKKDTNENEDIQAEIDNPYTSNNIKKIISLSIMLVISVSLFIIWILQNKKLRNNI